MIDQSVQPLGIIAGFFLCIAIGLLSAVFFLFPGRSVVRRFADWLFNRRGIEKLGTPMRVQPRESPYEEWLDSARSTIPVHDCLYIEDVRTIALEPWPEHGSDVTGLYLRLSDYHITDGRLLEIPCGGESTATSHMYEMGVYFLGGPGHTLLFEEGKQARRIDWGDRSVMSIPLNTRYQHINDGESPIRLLAVTSFPFMLNSINNQPFIKNNPFRFSDRMAQHAEGESEKIMGHGKRKFDDLIPDALNESLVHRPLRGRAVRNRYWTMSGNSTIDVNLSEMDSGTIKRAHRGNSDAVVLMLSGEGCCVTWPDGAWHKNIRINWREGTLIAAPIYWYRQFLNSGDTSARNLTFSAKSLVEKLGIRFLDQMENDLPEIRKIWAREIKGRAADKLQDN